MSSQDCFKRGVEEIRARYDDDGMLVEATLYRCCRLVERTESAETVKRWMRGEERVSGS